MSAAPEDTVWTLDDLLALPDDGRRHELLWGAIVMTPVPPARHADIVDDLAGRLRRICSGRPGSAPSFRGVTRPTTSWRPRRRRRAEPGSGRCW